MNTISSWLLSVAGVVILSVLAEFVLPDGKMNKHIKSIFSFVILLAIIMPLPKLFGKEFDLTKYFAKEENVLQEDYLYQINIDKLTALSTQLDDRVKQEGILNAEISINANVLTENMEIFEVFVDLCEIEYAENFGSKDITKAKLKILQIVGEFSLLNGVEVRFNE